jgi:hypothetical protein
VLLGALDIGSNSAQLQVVEVRPGAPPLPTLAVKEPTLLGDAFDAEGSIDIAGALREGIALHYLQTRLNETFALPLSPLNQVTGEDTGLPRRQQDREHPQLMQTP